MNDPVHETPDLEVVFASLVQWKRAISKVNGSMVWIEEAPYLPKREATFVTV